MPYLSIGLLLVFALLFYRVADIDGRHALAWAALSLAAGVLALSLLRWGIAGFLVAQLFVFVVMFATNRVGTSPPTNR